MSSGKVMCVAEELQGTPLLLGKRDISAVPRLVDAENHCCPVKDPSERCNTVRREDVRGNPACSTLLLFADSEPDTVRENAHFKSAGALRRVGCTGSSQ